MVSLRLVIIYTGLVMGPLRLSICNTGLHMKPVTDMISPGKIVSFINLLDTDHVKKTNSGRIFMKFHTKLKGHFKMHFTFS